jgi:hypothetical protein
MLLDVQIDLTNVDMLQFEAYEETVLTLLRA